MRAQKNFLTFCLVLTSLSALPVWAQASSAVGSATATIVTPIVITATQDLAFGKMSANNGGTVSISADGARSKVGTVVLVNTGSVQTEGKFNVTGDSSATYTITLPSTDVTVTDNNSHSMNVNTFISNPSATGTLSAGAGTVHVGGTLVVAAAQVAGAYAGTYAVTVEYN